MRLLKLESNGDFHLTENLLDNALPRYAILSHTWGSQEVTFEELVQDSGKSKTGYEKLKFCGEQTARDGLQYFWVDTCCIKKSSDSELSESINSMFRWYQRAEKCYVYLSDVSAVNSRGSCGSERDTWEQPFRDSRWFTRGWTLQELLAPASVEFFSKEGAIIGDKSTLGNLVQEITGISISALQGTSLSHFSASQKFGWATNRRTTREEDAAYCLLGIFHISMPVVYGEGRENAFRRLRQSIDGETKDRECLKHLFVTNPLADKIRIEDAKGGLILDSCQWILENEAFQQWRDGPNSQLLWIRGGPGKGKTMLLCRIVDILSRSTTNGRLVSYFYCQATDSRINNAEAVLRGLLWLLVDKQPTLISHIEKQYNRTNKSLFEDANAWVTLSDIFINILRDTSLKPTYFIVDALDECIRNRPKLLDFINQCSSMVPQVRWLVSSRHWPEIEEQLDQANSQVTVCLELNASSITTAVGIYIHHTVAHLALQKKYNDKTRETVLDYLVKNADDTYLWVALVCENLKKIPRARTCARLTSFPPGLDSLYAQMLKQICDSEESDLCKAVLASVTAVYEPITLIQLATFVEGLKELSDDEDSLKEIVRLCGSFLIIRDATVYFVHQSAKDYLVQRASTEILPDGIGETHHEIFSRSLDAMAKTLRRDIYGLCRPGLLIEQIRVPDPDPLEALRYSLIHWIDHLIDWISNYQTDEVPELMDQGVVDIFMRKKFLHWLEALSLCGMFPGGLIAMTNLQNLIKKGVKDTSLARLVQDARRFMMQNNAGIKVAPLQTYISALIFSPARSLIRRCFKAEEPNWIDVKPSLIDTWSNCLMTIEAGPVATVALAHDLTQLASLSYDKTIKIWDFTSGHCISTLKCDSGVTHIAFSSCLTNVIALSRGAIVQVWDIRSGVCLQRQIGHCGSVAPHAFSPDSTTFVSLSKGQSVKIWDIGSGECLYSLEGSNDPNVTWPYPDMRDQICNDSIAFSNDSKNFATAVYGNAIKILDSRTGECKQTLDVHGNTITSVAFSADSTNLISAAKSGTIKVWDVRSGNCLQTIKNCGNGTMKAFFSHDPKLLLSMNHKTIKAWDRSNGQCLHTLKVIDFGANFSQDLTCMASTSAHGFLELWDLTSWKCHQSLFRLDRHLPSATSRDLKQVIVGSRIWDVESGRCLQVLKCDRDKLRPLDFATDSKRFASTLNCSIYIWDINTGECLQTLNGHGRLINWAAFSKESILLASASQDGTVKIWHINTAECLHTLEGHCGSVLSAVFSEDSSLIASITYNPKVQVWDTAKNKCLQTFLGHMDRVISAALFQNSTRLVSTSRDGVTRVWDVDSGECLQILEVSSEYSFEEAVYSHDATRLALASSESFVAIWDMNSRKCLHTVKLSRVTRRMAFSHDSTQLALTQHEQIKIYDIMSSECIQTLEGHSQLVTSVVYSYDSRWLVSASADDTVKIWDAKNTHCSSKTESHKGLLRAIAFSPNSIWLASASNDMTIKVWDVSSGECLRTLKGHDSFVSWVAFSHNSTWIISGSMDNTIKIWDTSNFECLHTLRGHKDGIASTSLSYDSTRLASASHDFTVMLWDLNSSQCIKTFAGHRGILTSVAFSYDSTWLASGSTDNTVKIWDTKSGECLNTLRGHDGRVTSVAFTQPPIFRLATASSDRTVRIWDASSGRCMRILDTAKAPLTMLFDSTSSYLHTDIGTIFIDVLPSLHSTSSTIEHHTAKYLGLGVSPDGQWITYNCERLLWIPSDYRPRLSVVIETSIGIGTGTGKVWMCTPQVKGLGIF